MMVGWQGPPMARIWDNRITAQLALFFPRKFMTRLARNRALRVRAQKKEWTEDAAQIGWLAIDECWLVSYNHSFSYCNHQSTIINYGCNCSRVVWLYNKFCCFAFVCLFRYRWLYCVCRYSPLGCLQLAKLCLVVDVSRESPIHKQRKTNSSLVRIC